jgi:Na+-transporting NADH:ubiquinone oxidoreductase subunit NqrB
MNDKITFIEAIWLALFLTLLNDYSLTMLLVVIVLFPRWVALLNNVRTQLLYVSRGHKKEAQDFEKEIEEELKS